MRVDSSERVGAEQGDPDDTVRSLDDSIWQRVRRRHVIDRHMPRRCVEYAVEIRLLDRKPQVRADEQRSVWIPSVGRQYNLPDLTGGGVETSNAAGSVGRVPNTARRRNEDPVWSGFRRRGGIVRHLAGRRVELADKAVGLIGVPDGS